jgi:hypothetical protein
MAQVHFVCSNAQQIMRNWVETDVANLAEARERATTVVRSLLATPGPEDWRSWVLHVSDDLGEEVLALPFSSIMGSLH